MELQARLIGLPSHILHIKKQNKNGNINKNNVKNNNKFSINNSNNNNFYNIDCDNNPHNIKKQINNNCTDDESTEEKIVNRNDNNSNADIKNNNNKNSTNNISDDNNNNNNNVNEEYNKINKSTSKRTDKCVKKDSGSRVVKQDVEGNKADKSDANDGKVLGSRNNNDNVYLEDDKEDATSDVANHFKNNWPKYGGHEVGRDDGGEQGNTSDLEKTVNKYSINGERGNVRHKPFETSAGRDGSSEGAEASNHVFLVNGDVSHNVRNDHNDDTTNGCHDDDYSLSVHSISTILANSHFGPYECSVTEASNKSNSLKVTLKGEEKEVAMAGCDGLWLTLLKTDKRPELCNLRLTLSGGALSATVSSNILADMELVAEEEVQVCDTRGDTVNEEGSHHVKEPDPKVFVSTKKEPKSPLASPLNPSSTPLSPTFQPIQASLHTSPTFQSPSNHLFPNHSSDKKFPNHIKLSFDYPFGKKNEGFKDGTPYELANDFKRHHPPLKHAIAALNTQVNNSMPPESKTTYELIHECLFCGVKFSSPKTLQAHLANYCSKKPSIDVNNSNLLLHFMMMQDQIRYRYLLNQQLSLNRPDEDLPAASSDGTMTSSTVKVKNEKQDEAEGYIKKETPEAIDSKSAITKNIQPDLKEKLISSNHYSPVDKSSSKTQKSMNSTEHPLPLMTSNPLFNSFHNSFPFLPFFPFKYPPPPIMDGMKVPTPLNEASKASGESKQQPRNFETPIDLSGKKNSESFSLPSNNDQKLFHKNNGYQSSIFESYKKNNSKSLRHVDPIESFPPPKPPPNPSLTRCVECNIVFFKAENYLAHKQHYCASRNNPSTDSVQRNPNKSFKKYGRSSADKDSEAASSSDCDTKTLKQEESRQFAEESFKDASNDSEAEQIALSRQNLLHYYCIPCKIKFSSAETLKAHKRYYCSSRNSASESSESKENYVKKETNDHRTKNNVVKNKIKEETTRNNDPPTRQDSNVTCSLCMGVFHSEQAIALHLCAPSSTEPLFHCPHCEHLSHGEDLLIEHLRSHAPTKVFRCLLCGYRGNTVRGMRMHGKMHNDAGENFTDDSMVEMDEPPSFSKKIKSLVGSSMSPYALPNKHASHPSSQQYLMQAGYELPEIELIRMKNEPYKRRRSRKAYEKSEYKAKKPLDDGFVCPKCLAVFSNDSHLQIHMLSHMSSPSSTSFQTPPIKTASYSHLPLAIKTELSNDASTPTHQQMSAKSCSDVNNNHVTPPHNKRLKLSPSEFNGDTRISDKTPDKVFFNTAPLFTYSPHSAALSKGSKQLQQSFTHKKGTRNGEECSTEHNNGASFGEQDTSKYCKQCNINFMYTSTYQAHKKYYCSSLDAEEEEEDKKS